VQISANTQVQRGIQLQLLLLLLLTGLLVLDRSMALSAMAGCFIATISHIWFAWRALKGSASEPGQILGAVYRAEVGKLVLIIMLFIAAFILIKPISVVSLMVAYLFTTWIPWLTSYFMPDDSKPGDIKNVR
jgi:ATP synthase protein I